MNSKFVKFLSPVFEQNPFAIHPDDVFSFEKQAIQCNTWQLLYTLLKKRAAPTGKNTIQNKAVDAFLTTRKISFLKNVARTLKQQSFEQQLINALQQNGIAAAVLKGSAISQHIYQDVYCRNSCDIDLLIRESDIEKTHEIAIQENLKRIDSTPLSFLPQRLHHTSYYSHGPVFNEHLEVHWNFSIPGFFRLSSDEIWQHIEQDADGAYCLNADMTLVLLLMHHHRHSFMELRNLVDLLWAFFRYENEINWRAFTEKVKQIGLVKTSVLTIRQMETQWPEEAKRLPGIQNFKAELDHNNSHKILPKLLAGHVANFEDTAFSTKDKIIYRLALDHWHTVLFSFIKSVMPPPKAIKALYNNSSNIHLPWNYIRYFYQRATNTLSG